MGNKDIQTQAHDYFIANSSIVFYILEECNSTNISYVHLWNLGEDNKTGYWMKLSNFHQLLS